MASELISRLIEAVTIHGDLPVEMIVVGRDIKQMPLAGFAIGANNEGKATEIVLCDPLALSAFRAGFYQENQTIH